MATKIEECRELVKQGYVLETVQAHNTAEGEKYDGVYCNAKGEKKTVFNLPPEVVEKAHLKPEYSRRVGVTRLGKTEKKRAKEAEARAKQREIEAEAEARKTPAQREAERKAREQRLASEQAARDSRAKKDKGKKK